MNIDPDAPASLEDGLFGLGVSPMAAAVTVIPVPWQATTSYRRGTASAPLAVLEASLQVDLHDRVTGSAWQAGIAMLPMPLVDWDAEAEGAALQVIQAGGAHTPELAVAAQSVDQIGEQVRAWVYAHARDVLARGGIPAVLGGDHSCPLGLMQAIGERGDFGVLHIDAHADLRVAYEGFELSHASIFHNVLERVTSCTKLVQVGIRDFGKAEAAAIAADERIHTFFDADLAWERAQGSTWMSQVERILAPLPQRVYLSVDIDGLQPELCPNTGTPVPGGLSWDQFTVLLRALEESGRQILGFDLCEVGPGQWDAIVGARALYRLACHAIGSRG